MTRPDPLPALIVRIDEVVAAEQAALLHDQIRDRWAAEFAGSAGSHKVKVFDERRGKWVHSLRPWWRRAFDAARTRKALAHGWLLGQRRRLRGGRR